MANISSVGIGSGVLTSELIEKLVAAERGPTEQRLKVKEAKVTAELSVFGLIQSAITDLRLPSRSLADPKLFNQLSVTSGNSAFSATASATASAGSYTLEVNTLAKAHSLSTGDFADADSTAVGTGTLSFTINGEATNLVIDGTNNTLNGIAAAINEEDFGVSASVIYTGTGYRLAITSEETGVDNAMTIAVTDTGDAGNTDAFGLSRLSYTTGGFNLTQNQAATDAEFDLNGIPITRSSNIVDDVLTGVTLTFTGTNVGSPSPLVIKRDTETIVDKVEEFVDKFNALRSLIGEHTKFNPDDPTKNGVLLGDASTRNVFTQMRNLLGRAMPGLEGQSVQSIAEIGISTDKTTGLLTFNSTTFLAKYNADPQSVAALFADQGRTSDGQIEFVRAGNKTKVGTYDVAITQTATKATYSASVALGLLTPIDGTNDTFALTVDGTTSGTITLTQNAGYSASALAAHIQDRINADSTLSAAGKSVSVTLDASNRLVITSATYGGDSSVALTAVDTNTASGLGLNVGKGPYQGNVALGTTTTIDSDNDAFTLSINGTTSNAIALTAGDYTAANLATHIQTQINADANFTGAGIAVTVSLDASNRLMITTSTPVANASVSMASVDTNSALELGFGVRGGGDGLDVAGTINGKAATGDGQLLTAAVGDDTEQIRLKVNGGAVGNRGTVTYMEGIGEQMVDLINSLLEERGTITAKNDRMNSLLEGIAEERSKLALRITSLNERLVRQFTAADIIVARLNSTQDFVSRQLDAILGSNKKD